NTTPNMLSIVGIDTLSRRTKNIAYYAEKHSVSAATVAA
ncbi:TPA: restriction endonuclease subunit M, partial [Klebsiella pneumoniae subsp. pneumoniae]|nr:restriction endonuclease subunit M [Klebsiella pneumoniae subsp. pneumoniae]